MLSLVLYGRNDNHGYNLHKRAAISLNAMAEVLTGADDEIVFVDYNTPDDLPSFPEAIGDTLTERAREKLRVLRVRPRLHAPFRSKTHLVALESISRNIALRRTNPANRWVLSTNTDMIFVPHKDGASLSDIVSGLQDGFYQLPRFELPEVLWESFDRKDGAGMIARTRDWAKRFHLNEIVYGSDDILYDGPGDFQLCLRSDLIGIQGFHEGMLRGWHVDANLCARMKLLHGEIKTLAGELFAYHCDHTRQATPAHTHNRVENDAEDFIKAVTRPQLPEQAQTWGLPNEEIEEIRLGRGDTFTRYLKSLETAIEAPQENTYESAYRSETFGELTYRRAHVLPFVLDLVAPFERDTRVFYAGARDDTFSDFLRAHRRLTGAARVFAAAEHDWANDAPGVEALPLARALDEADLFIFEFGTGEPGAAGDRKEMARRLGSVRRTLIAAASAEQARLARGAPPRRVIAVNAIHNEYEALVANYLAFTLTPFSSRVRHGYFLAAGDTQKTFDVREVWRDVQRQTGRSRTLPMWETQELRRLALASASVAPEDTLPSEALAHAETLAALLRHASVHEAVGIEPQRAAALSARFERERPGRAVFEQLSSIPGRAGARDPALGALSRAADASDWEKPAFARFVDNHFGGARAYGAPDRNLWTWERAGVLDVLDEAGLLKSDARILLVSTVPDALAPALADHAQVEVARPAKALTGAFLSERPSADADTRGFEDGLTRWAPDDAERFDAVVFIQHAIMAHGPGQVATALSEAAAVLKLGGVILFSVDTCLSGAPEANDFSADAMLDGTFAVDLAPSGFEFCGPFEARLTAMSCDRLVNHQRSDLRHRNMVSVNDDRVATESIVTLRRKADAPNDAALNKAALAHVMTANAPQAAISDTRRLLRRMRSEAVRGVFRSPVAREMIANAGIVPKLLQREWTWDGAPEHWADRLHTKSGVETRAGAFTIPANFAEGHAIYGPYLPLYGGKWRLRFRAEVIGGEGEGEALLVDVTQGQVQLAARPFTAEALDGGEQSLTFVAHSGILFELARDMDMLNVETRFAPRKGVALRIWDIKLEAAD